MDPVCHTLAGLAMGHAGLKRRTPLALTTLALAANAPDIDIAVMATDTLAVYARRGWTHGPPAMVVLPLALTALVLAYDRLVRQRAPAPPHLRLPASVGKPHRPPTASLGKPHLPPTASVGRPHLPPMASAGRLRVVPREVLLVAALGTWSHPLLDYMNSYGIRLLMPFSGRWFHGDALYIVDPWLSLALGAGVWMAWRSVHGDVARGRRAARRALVAAAIYVAAMYGSNLWARRIVATGLERAGRAGARFMVTPVAVNPFRREVIIDLGDRYEKGFLTFAPWPEFRPAGYGVETRAGHPASRAAAATEVARQFLTWSRFPFYVIEATAEGVVVTLNDYRYAGPAGTEGWAAVRIPVAPASP
jgi:inner membrane protein